jgi:hypothetical protein
MRGEVLEVQLSSNGLDYGQGSDAGLDLTLVPGTQNYDADVQPGHGFRSSGEYADVVKNWSNGAFPVSPPGTGLLVEQPFQRAVWCTALWLPESTARFLYSDTVTPPWLPPTASLTVSYFLMPPLIRLVLGQPTATYASDLAPPVDRELGKVSRWASWHTSRYVRVEVLQYIRVVYSDSFGNVSVAYGDARFELHDGYFPDHRFTGVLELSSVGNLVYQGPGSNIIGPLSTVKIEMG